MTDVIERLNAVLVGRYEVEREIGEGGMATVFVAKDLKHHRPVALKVLKPDLAAVIGAERFLAEIETTANLQHPHILPLHDSGEANGLLFYVMPYVEGESLRERLDREHQLPVADAVRIATNIAEALDYAHRQGIIHRDIKPANVLLQDGKPVINDFGIALAVSAGGLSRPTETWLSRGTPHYMSPEQATGDQSVDLTTDIYALGCVLYEMLVGEPPFTGSTPQAVLGQIITGETPSAAVERKAVPPHVDATVARALESIPADRFRSAGAFAAALGDPGFRYGGQLAGGGTRVEVVVARLLLAVALVVLGGEVDSYRLVAVRFDGGEIVDLGPGLSPRFLAPGRLVFSTYDGLLMVAPFDPETFEMGPAVATERRVGVGEIGTARFDLSERGDLISSTGSTQSEVRELTGEDEWSEPLLVAPGIESLTVSPDGSTAAFVRRGNIRANRTIWLADLQTWRLRQFPFGQSDRQPAWSADGSFLVYSSDPDGQRQPGSRDLWSRPADGSRSPDTILDARYHVHTPSLSSDGRLFFVYQPVLGDIHVAPRGVDLNRAGFIGDSWT